MVSVWARLHHKKRLPKVWLAVTDKVIAIVLCWLTGSHGYLVTSSSTSVSVELYRYSNE